MVIHEKDGVEGKPLVAYFLTSQVEEADEEKFRKIAPRGK